MRPLSPVGPFSDPDERFLIRLRDGIRLAADLYLPQSKNPGPVILIRTPYGKRTVASPVLPSALYLRQAGFAVLVQDVRGLGNSEGDRAPFIHEVADAADTLDWLVRQPWSNGLVGCWGNSYYGFTAWAAVASGHPSIRALVSRVTSVNPLALLTHNGVPRLGPVVDWACTTWQPSASDIGSIDWSARPSSRLIQGSAARSLILEQLQDQQEMRALLLSALGQVPTLHCAGWFDLFSSVQMQEWRMAAQTGVRQYLLVTATDHMDDLFSFAPSQADHLADFAAQQTWLSRTLDPVIVFLRAQLMGRQDDATLIRWELTGSGLRHEQRWPPAEAVCCRFYPVSAGEGQGHGLCQRREQSAGTLSWEHDPVRCVPACDSDWWRPLLRPGDARYLADREDVLTFTAAATSLEACFAGLVTLTLTVSSTAHIYHLIATLCDVAPDGTSRVLLQAPWRTAVQGGQVQILLGELGYQQAVGHRLRLHLASSCFPLYMPQTDDASSPWLTVGFARSRQTIYLPGCELQMMLLPS